MAVIHQKSTLEAPVATSFAYVDDPANVPQWMFGVSKFSPQDPSQSRGLGAVYDVVFSVKAVKIKTMSKVVEYVENELIRFDTVKGFHTESTWRFAADGEGRSTLEVEFQYDVPGGLAGKALGRALEPVLGLAVKESEKTLARKVAELHAG